MKRLIITLLFFTMIGTLSLAKATMAKTEDPIMNEIIHNIYNSEVANGYTCDSVVLYSEGKITKQNCEAQLEKTNAQCASMAKSSLSALLTESDAKNLVQILVTCPVAKMLGHPYEIKDGRAHMPEN